MINIVHKSTLKDLLFTAFALHDGWRCIGEDTYEDNGGGIWHTSHIDVEILAEWLLELKHDELVAVISE